MATILIVDDEKSIRRTLHEFVKEDGHEALTAEDAEEGLRIVLREPVDIVVTDIILPRVTGVSLLERIQQARPDVQVIMITGEPTVDTAAAAVRSGAFDYLSKPIVRDEFKAVVASAVRVKALAEERARLEAENLRYREHLEEEIERTSHALKESEEKYRTVVENANEAVFVAQGGTLPFTNPKSCSITGYTSEQLKEIPFSELVHPEDRALVAERLERRLRGEDVEPEYEFRVVTGSGEVRWIEIRPVLIEWEGRPATLNFATDITERIAAERALVESESRYRTLFENSPISLWQEDYSQTKALLDELQASGVRDLEAQLRSHPELVEECIQRIRVVDVNRTTVAMHAAGSRAELIGNLSRLIPPESRDRFVEQLVAIAKGTRTFETTGLDRRLDGSKMHVAVRWTVAPGFEETLERVLVSKVDISATVEAEQALRRALDGTIEAIGLTTETRDPYTAGHQRRVTALAVAIAEELGLAEPTTEGTRAAGLLHDIGKMAVPAEILSKPSRLTAVEEALIQSHPQIAYDILKSVSFPWPLAKIVLQHHERIDGSGYPQGLAGDAIRVEARVLAVADVVEAMASHRPYRAALGIDAALEEIEANRGTLYDSDAVDACLRLFREDRFAFVASGLGPV